MFGPGASADGAGAEQLAGPDRFAQGGVRDQFFGFPCHHPTRAARPFRAVHARHHLELVQVKLVARDNPRPKRGGEIFAFRRAKAGAHLTALNIAGAEVIEDRDAKEVFERFFGQQVAPRLADDETEFELVVHHLGVARPRHFLLVADHGEGADFQIDRLLEKLFGVGLTHAPLHRPSVRLKGREIADKRRIEWRNELHIGKRANCRSIGARHRPGCCLEKGVAKCNRGGHAGWEEHARKAQGCLAGRALTLQP